MINFVDDFDDKEHADNCLFTDVLNIHAPVRPVKLTKVKTKPNPYITLNTLRILVICGEKKQLKQWINFTGMPIASLGKK